MFGSTMVRWRNVLILALLLLLPVRTGSEEDDDDNDNESEGNEDDEGDDEAEPTMKEIVPRRRVAGGVGGVNIGHVGSSGNEGGDGGGNFAVGRRAPSVLAATQATNPVTRTMRRPLECYVCSYKSDSFLRSCLDPTKYRVHTMACHNVEDKCFTAVTSRGSSYEAVMRGCRSGCIATPETTCCATDRCNNQAMAMPVIAPRAMMHGHSKANKVMQPTVLFFVTVLLVLQTVVKVAVV